MEKHRKNAKKENQNKQSSDKIMRVLEEPCEAEQHENKQLLPEEPSSEPQEPIFPSDNFSPSQPRNPTTTPHTHLETLTITPPGAVCCVQFLQPAVKQLHSTQAAVLGLNSDRLGLPPPGFLEPTRYLVVGLRSGRVAVWDFEMHTWEGQWDGHTPHPVVAIANVRHTHFATLGAGHALRVWSATSHAHTCELSVLCLHEIALPGYPELLGCDGFDLFTEGKTIVAALPNGDPPHTIEVWAVDCGVVVSELRFKDPSEVDCLIKLKWVEKKGKVVLMAGYNLGFISVWDWANQVIRCTLDLEGQLLSFEYDSSKHKGVACLDNKVCVFTMNTSLILSAISSLPRYSSTVERCLSRHDGKYFAASDGRVVRMFAWSNQRLVSTLDGLQDSSVSSVAFSYSAPLGLCGASAAHDGTLEGLPGAQKGTTDEAKLDTPHILAVGSLNGLVWLWSME